MSQPVVILNIDGALKFYRVDLQARTFTSFKNENVGGEYYIPRPLIRARCDSSCFSVCERVGVDRRFMPHDQVRVRFSL